MNGRTATCISVIALTLLVLPGCEVDSPNAPSTPAITLGESSLNMAVGESRGFDIGVAGVSLPDFTFTVAPPSLASVSQSPGRAIVTCSNAGSGVITVTAVVNGKTLTAQVPIVCRETTLIDLTPASLEFTHVVGSTGCPQRVGTFRVTNTAGFPLTIGVVSLNSALEIDATTQFPLEPMAFRDVVVTFNCSTQTSFVGSINVSASVPGRIESKKVQVTATINR